MSANLDPKIEMLLDKIYLNESIFLSGRIEKPILDDHIAG
jgi:hypothetical protein